MKSRKLSTHLYFPTQLKKTRPFVNSTPRLSPHSTAGISTWLYRPGTSNPGLHHLGTSSSGAPPKSMHILSSTTHLNSQHSLTYSLTIYLSYSLTISLTYSLFPNLVISRPTIHPSDMFIYMLTTCDPWSTWYIRWLTVYDVQWTLYDVLSPMCTTYTVHTMYSYHTVHWPYWKVESCHYPNS